MSTSDKTVRELGEVVGIDALVRMGLADEDEQTFATDEVLFDSENTDLSEIVSLLWNLQSTRQQLQGKAAELTYRLERVADTVGKWMHVNSLGEIQSQGSGFDVLCALYEERAMSLVRACNRYARTVAVRS
jgi:hypothetical protein